MGEAKLKHRVVIVGGGFGGIRAAQQLAKHRDEFDITLISDRPHFEYHAALYRVVTGRSPLEVCIPLSTIFSHSAVKVVEDTAKTVYPKTKQLIGESGSNYAYDSLILALGSQTAYFDVQGLRERSFALGSITDALRMKRHLHEIFDETARQLKDGQKKAIHLVVVGGGTTGVELSGELAIYARVLAKKHRLSPNIVTIDLFEATDRLLARSPEKVSQLAYQRLHRLGVNIFLDTPITERQVETVYLKDVEIRTKTLIWTAGVRPNQLYSTIKGLALNKYGRVLVDPSMQARGTRDLYVIGDAAASAYSGMAQTAVDDGAFVAGGLHRKLHGRPPIGYTKRGTPFGKSCGYTADYRPHQPIAAIPIGPGWAMVLIGNRIVTGWIGWILRKLADLKFFLSILPVRSALVAFTDGYRLSESCPVCSKSDQSHHGA